MKKAPKRHQTSPRNLSALLHEFGRQLGQRTPWLFIAEPAGEELRVFTNQPTTGIRRLAEKAARQKRGVSKEER